jgi:hypothetical protein
MELVSFRCGFSLSSYFEAQGYRYIYDYPASLNHHLSFGDFPPGDSKLEYKEVRNSKIDSI